MAFVSLTRLRLRSALYLPLFGWHAFRSSQQVKRSPGYLTGKVLPDHDRTFWTMTAWETRESMRAYMTSGSHMRAMPHLMHWCDEASVAHWEQESDALPTWAEASQRMRESGRPSKVNRPSPNHAALNYREPKSSAGVPL